MRGLLALTWREIRSYFSSPVAYVALTTFLMAAGFFFFLIFSWFTQDYVPRYDMLRNQNPHGNFPVPNVTEMIIMPLTQQMSLVLLFIVPMLSMRLLAEEKRLGTLELLYTYPISDLQVVMAKFAAAVTILIVMLGISLAYPSMIALLADRQGTVAPGPLFAGYLGLFLQAMAFMAIGMFFSSLTNNQMVAGSVTFTVLLLSWVVGWLGETSFFKPGEPLEIIGYIATHISLLKHFEDFSRGLITTQSTVFYLFVVFFGVFLTFQSVQSNRWRG